MGISYLLLLQQLNAPHPKEQELCIQKDNKCHLRGEGKDPETYKSKLKWSTCPYLIAFLSKSVAEPQLRKLRSDCALLKCKLSFTDFNLSFPHTLQTHILRVPSKQNPPPLKSSGQFISEELHSQVIIHAYYRTITFKNMNQVI